MHVVLTIRYYSANENTVAAGKKTILPADVFKALDDTEFSFLKEPLEAEFASMFAQPPPPEQEIVIIDLVFLYTREDRSLRITALFPYPVLPPSL